jgi:hypothetical protein
VSSSFSTSSAAPLGRERLVKSTELRFPQGGELNQQSRDAPSIKPDSKAVSESTDSLFSLRAAVKCGE